MSCCNILVVSCEGNFELDCFGVIEKFGGAVGGVGFDGLVNF